MPPQGCLTALFRLFGVSARSPSPDRLPYRRRDDFLSAVELSFYRVLAAAIGDRATICPKVNLADIVYVAAGQAPQRYRNKIDRKHVDFLVCHPHTLQPCCGIELDDASHERRDRRVRDRFVEEVFAAAELPLIRVPARSSYHLAELRQQLESVLAAGAAMARPPAAHAQGAIPTCRRCGVAMTERTAKRGLAAGQKFFGCVNYPRCREVVQI